MMMICTILTMKIVAKALDGQRYKKEKKEEEKILQMSESIGQYRAGWPIRLLSSLDH